jgi:D-psicose/D-tagatose/L-ribulose 3-epimerase
MRFGCCGSMIAPDSDPIGIETVETLAALGFDYVELSLAHVTALSDGDFHALSARLEDSGLVCEACNNFFPATVRVTGSEASLPAARDYAAHAMERAAGLGARIIVFGSSGAKNVPPGFAHDEAWSQIVELLGHLGPMAKAHGITIAIEPISRMESNIVNTAADGLILMHEVNHPNIRLLIDFYHLRMENESPAILLEAGESLRHVHFARLQERGFPIKPEADFAPFFDALHHIGYRGRCSIEGYTKDFTAEARHALHMLRTITERYPI